MVNNHIKVYARIKYESNGHKTKYDIQSDDHDSDVMKIYNSGTSFKRKRRAFKFNKVFGSHSTQEDIFNDIAKPIIHDVFNGLNATIFAYGATGSGKTYTLTGSQKKYEQRGLIPRTIEYIFKLVTNKMTNYMFFISYLEIYNENAYDLLNPKQQVTCLEELPRVIVLEDDKGEAHFKNLCLKEVNTEKEAMRLLYAGDNNRTIAETPLNDYSSRSHCVFTVHVISKCHTTGAITRSKLNLVDLAGSERLHRMNLHGMTLNEARHINLSLHYLERVIQALSQKGKPHVPYRNSMMTFILRDSLGGNCLTAMLATLSMVHLNIEETLSTCKFAQRVCLIKLDANVNYVPTPEREVNYLRNELRRLRREMHEKNNINRKLSREEEDECKFAVKQFLQGKEELKLDDTRKVKFYIECMRDKLVKSKSQEMNVNAASNASVKNVRDIEKQYQRLVDQKNEDMHMLLSVQDHGDTPTNLFKPVSEESLLNKGAPMTFLEKKNFKKYLSSNALKEHYDNCVKQIKMKYHEAVRISQTLMAKQKEIAFIKRAIAKSDAPSPDLRLKLNLDQSFYREQLRKMHNIKGDIEDLKNTMYQVRQKIIDDYRAWSAQNTGSEIQLEVPFGRNAECTRKFTNTGEFDATLLGAVGNKQLKPKFDSLKLKRVIEQYDLEQPKLGLEQQVGYKENACQAEYTNAHNCQQPCFVQENPCCSYILRDVCNSCNLCSTACVHHTMKPKARSFHSQQDVATATSNHTEIPVTEYMNAAFTTHMNCRSNSKLDASHQAQFSTSAILSGDSETALNRTRERFNPLVGNFLDIKPSVVQSKSLGCVPNRAIVIHSARESRRIGDAQMSVVRPTDRFVLTDDRPEFVKYIQTIPLTGDFEVDEEIIKFYRLKFNRLEVKLVENKI